MLSEGLKKKLVKSAVTGAILSTAITAVYGMGTIPVAGYNLPAIVPAFATGAGASLISDFAHDQLYPHLPGASAKLSDVVAVGAGAGMSAAATVGIMKLAMGLPNESLLPAALLGAGSYVASDWVESRLLESNGKLIF
jgi:hypothetical protein